MAYMGASEASLGNVPMIQDQRRVWYNPNQNDAWFIPIAELLTTLAIFILMPMIFLSDAWTPPEARPAELREVMNLSPVYYSTHCGVRCWA